MKMNETALWNIVEVVLGLIPLAIGIAWVFLRINRKERQLKRLADHREANFDIFYSSLPKSLDHGLAEAAYEYLQIQLLWAHGQFPVHLTDLLKNDCDMDSSDVVSVIKDIRGGFPDIEVPTERRARKLQTVGDLVYFLDDLRAPPI